MLCVQQSQLVRFVTRLPGTEVHSGFRLEQHVYSLLSTSASLNMLALSRSPACTLWATVGPICCGFSDVSLLAFVNCYGQAGIVRFPSQPTSSNHSQPFPYAYPPPPPQPSACSFWLEEIQHPGIAPFQGNASYPVFWNVKDYSAKGPLACKRVAEPNWRSSGHGVTDDNCDQPCYIWWRWCAPGSCASTTTTTGIVYFTMPSQLSIRSGIGTGRTRVSPSIIALWSQYVFQRPFSSIRWISHVFWLGHQQYAHRYSDSPQCHVSTSCKKSDLGKCPAE